MYKLHYDAVKAHLNAALPSIKTVDWYNNQYTRYKDLKAIKFPAAYIEFQNPMTWQTIGENVQTADTKIIIPDNARNNDARLRHFMVYQR